MTADIATLEGLLARESDPVELDWELVARVVEVFSDWRSLARAEKRELLAAYRIRVRILTPRPRRPEVDSVVMGVLSGESRDNEVLYKKMKRLGID